MLQHPPKFFKSRVAKEVRRGAAHRSTARHITAHITAPCHALQVAPGEPALRAPPSSWLAGSSRSTPQCQAGAPFDPSHQLALASLHRAACRHRLRSRSALRWAMPSSWRHPMAAWRARSGGRRMERRAASSPTSSPRPRSRRCSASWARPTWAAGRSHTEPACPPPGGAGLSTPQSCASLRLLNGRAARLPLPAARDVQWCLSLCV